MKTIKMLCLSLIAVMIASTSCKKDKDFGDPILTASATTVSTNQEITITLSGVETSEHGYSAYNTWTKVSGPDFTTISGGREKDKTWTIKFSGTGTAIIQCSADFCRHGSCLGEKTAKTTITVQ